MIPAIIAGASALASMGVGIANSISQNEANEKNYALQRKAFNLQREQQEYNQWANQRDFDYNSRLQQQIFQREDSAVQRMVADNRAAGLSPIAGLAGAGTGQALEANTAHLNQNFDAPQMSANQLNIDFSSLNNLSSVIQKEEQFKDSLKLNQQKLELEKSSNEANLKQMEANLKATKLENQFKQATLDSRIESSKLAPKKVQQEIAKSALDIVSESLGNEIKELEKIQTKREMQEWLENKGLREELGNKSLEKIKQDILLKELFSGQNQEKHGAEMAILQAQLEALERENVREGSWDQALDDLGLNSGESRLLGSVLGGLLRILK